MKTRNIKLSEALELLHSLAVLRRFSRSLSRTIEKRPRQIEFRTLLDELLQECEGVVLEGAILDRNSVGIVSDEDGGSPVEKMAEAARGD